MYEIIVMGLIGLAVGSFLNVVADRVPAGKSLLAPPSHCPSCGTALRPLDLVPVFSYLALRGRCRYCGAGIGPRSAAVEAVTAVLFALATWRWGFTPSLAPMLVLASALIVLFVTDLERRLIPNTVTLFAAAALLVLAPWNPLLAWTGSAGSVAQALLGGLAGAGILLVIFVASRGGMGAGDIKLGGVLGLALGPALAVTALFVAFMAGGVFAAALLVMRRRRRKDFLPFGTFLGLAGLTAASIGPALYRWYLDMLRVG